MEAEPRVLPVWVFCECIDCGFVLEAGGETDPEPKRWESCPGCDGTAFRFL